MKGQIKIFHYIFLVFTIAASYTVTKNYYSKKDQQLIDAQKTKSTYKFNKGSRAQENIDKQKRDPSSIESEDKLSSSRYGSTNSNGSISDDYETEDYFTDKKILKIDNLKNESKKKKIAQENNYKNNSFSTPKDFKKSSTTDSPYELGVPDRKTASAEVSNTTNKQIKHTSTTGSSQNPVIKGIIPPLIGVVAFSKPFDLIDSAYSAASSCINPKITIFDIQTMTVLADNPLTEEDLKSDTAFSFDPYKLNLSMNKPTKYLLKTSGCDVNYERIVTSFYSNQNLTPTSTLVSKIIKSSANVVFEDLDGLKIQDFIDSVLNQTSGTSEIETSYSLVDTSLDFQNKFTSVFNGENYQVLAVAAPDVKNITAPQSLTEKTPAIFSTQTQHWSTSYITGYEWHIDGVKQSNSATWNYTPTANSKNSISVKLFIGRAVAALGSDVDRTYPFHEITYPVTIVDSSPVVAPTITLNSGSSDPSSSANIFIDINTGAIIPGTFQNCETFTDFAITEGATLPIAANFTNTCTTATVQVHPHTLISADGDVPVNIWARDINGNISSKKTITISLDTSAPTISITNLNALNRADTLLNLNWTTNEANQNSSNLHSIEFFNGSIWTSLPDVASGNGFINNQAFSTSFLLPNIQVSNAKFRVGLTDALGNSTLSESNFFAIARPVLSVSPTSFDFGLVPNNSTGSNNIFTISNTGNASTKGCNLISLTGANPLEFNIVSDNCATNTIGADANCTATFRPIPTTKGAKAATANWQCDLDSISTSLTYNSANNLPTVPSAYAISTNEDTLLNFSATSGSDLDGDTLTYIITSPPSNGSLTNCLASNNDLTCDYLPNLNFNGSDSFSYKVNDGTSDSSSSVTVTINISPVNDAPTLLTPQSFATNEDTTLNFNLGIGSDIEANTLTYIKLSDPASGALTCTGGLSTSCNFVPVANFNGPVSFTYKVNDGSLDSNIATVNITVNPINDAPTLTSPQSIATNEDTPITFDLVAGNDTEGDTLTYLKITNTTNGSIICSGGISRSCTYTPNLNFNGSDSFTYKVNDSSLDSATATVNITVNPINDAPTLSATQTVNVTEDTLLVFSLNPGSDVDLDTLTYIITQPPSAGTLSCSGGTSTSCTYNPIADDINTYTFKYKVNDGNLDSPEATVTININNTNDAPVMIGDQTIATNEDVPVAFTLSGATDIDPSQTISYKVITSPSNGVLTNCINPSSFTTDITCTYTPNANFNGTDSFSYRANDGIADSSSVSIVTINVAAINDVPTLSSPQAVATNEDTPITFNLTAGSDIEGDTLSYIKITNTTNGSIVCIGGTSRSCTYTPNADYNGADAFTYKVNDGVLDSTTATVNITINAINDAPTLAASQAISTNEDTPITFNLTAGSDTEGSTLNYIKLTNTSNGSIVCTGGVSRSCTYTPNLNFNGSDSFNYKVNDGSLDSTASTVTITVNPVNDAPTLLTPQNFATNEDTLLNFNLGIGTDIEGDALSYIKLTNPASGTLACTGGASTACSYTPSLNYNGVVSFTYKVNDGSLDSNNAIVNITVNAVNDAPDLASPQAISTNEDTAITFDLDFGSDAEGDTLSYIKVTNTSNGVITCTGGTSRSCTYTPNLNFNGTDSFTYKVNDGALDSTIATVNITINAINDAPSLSSPQAIATNEDTPITFDLVAGSDIEGSTLTYIKITNSSNGSIVCTGGTSRSCTYTPNANYNGSDVFTYKVNDGSLDSVAATVNITVNAINDPPVMAANQSFSTDDNVAINFTISNATDPEGDSLSYKIISPTSNGTITNCITTGVFLTDLTCTYQANLNFNGIDSFTYVANDGTLNALTNATISFTVSDKTPPTSPAIILAHSQYRNVLGQNLTATSCTDTPSIFINEGSQPTALTPGWQACTTTASALAYTLATTTQGLHTLKAWSKDAQGNVSNVATSIGVEYDTVLPVIAITNPGLQRGADTININWAVSELNISSSQNHTIQYFDGSGWITITSTKAASNGPLVSTPFSTSWTTPILTRSDIKIRVILSDLAGNTATTDSSTFEIDSTAPAAPSISLFSSPISNSTLTTTTVNDCTDLNQVLIRDSNTIPSVNDVSWQSCNTTPGHYAQTLSSPIQGVNNMYIFAKDLAGNISSSSLVSMTYDTVLPVIAFDMTSFIQGNATADVVFKLTDLNTSSSQNILFEYHNGTSWTSTNISAISGPLIQKIFTTSVVTPNSNNTPLQLKVTFSDLAGNQSIASTTVNTDTSVPTLISLDVNSGGLITGNNNVNISLSATESISNVAKFCLKVNDSANPIIGDNCWVDVNAPSPGITPAQSISFSNYFFLLGFAPGSYNVYAWVQDSARNISVNTASLNVDMYTITYNPGTPPVAADAIATESDTPSNPTTAADLTVGNGNDIYVKWNAYDSEGLAVNPISLKYSLNDVDYIDLPGAQNLNNGINGACTLTGSFTGCAVVTSPTGSYLRLRVIVKDDAGTTVFYNTPLLNDSKLRIIAGNTEDGLNGSARTAIFYRHGIGASVANMYKSKMAVSDDGKFFFIDPSRGLLWINPTSGNLEKFILSTGSSTGDNGPISAATLASAQAIALDHSNNLLIWDTGRIRKVNLSTYQITTLLGGGASTDPTTTINALDISLSSFNGYSGTLTPMPNGDLIFTSPANTLHHRRYRASDQKIELIETSGTGFTGHSSDIWSDKSKLDIGIVYNSTTSAINFMAQGIYKTYVGDSYQRHSRIDFTSGSENTPYSGVGPYDLPFTQSYMYTGLNGKLYTVPRFRHSLSEYNHDTNVSTRILGTGVVSSTPCIDGTLATSCAVDIDSIFVSKSNQVYFMDNGLFRTIDDQGKVVTLFGQYSGYGDGVIATSSRIASIGDLRFKENANPNKIVIQDNITNMFREFVIDGNINNIATPSYGWDGPYSFETDPLTGDIYYPAGYTIKKIDNITKAITNVVGNGANNYHLSSTDGKIGSDINLVSGYRVETLGFIDGKFYYRKHAWSAGSNYGCTIKAYDINDSFRQSHIMGNSTTDCALSVNIGTNLSDSGTAGAFMRFKKISDPEDSIVKEFFAPTNSATIYKSLNGGPIQSAISLPRGVGDFTHKVDGTGLNLFYCASGNLYQYNYNTTVETRLYWDSTTIKCASSKILYHQGRNSIIFGFSQSGLYGVAEYDLN